MNREIQIELAENFRKMHSAEGMMILPNAWDAGSAYIFQKEGFKAVGTTSAGIAYSLGYEDGENITLDELVYVVNKITRRIGVPLSVDFERGYGESIHEIKDSAAKLLEAGAVGFNIEDGRADGSLEEVKNQLEKIKTLVKLREERGIPFVINARTCVYWNKLFSDRKSVEIAVERGNLFLEAGADCVFVPGLIGEHTVRELVDRIKGPVNIVLNPKCHDLNLLENIGVKRLSIGSAAVRKVYGEIKEISKELQGRNVKKIIFSDFSYGEAQEYFTD